MLKNFAILILSTALGFSLACAQEGQKEATSSDTTKGKTASASDTLKAKATSTDTATAKATKTAPITSKNPVVVIETNLGNFEVELFMKEAPITAKNFLDLVNKGFYKGLTFHRIVPDFVIQGGDPQGDGMGGPGYSIPDEKTIKKHNRGTLGMAKAGPNTAGSQFYINLVDNFRLDKGYTVFAQVIKGMEVVDKIGKVKTSADERPLEKVVLVKVYVKKQK